MTKEQWLVYLWGIYPDGSLTVIWVILLMSALTFTAILFLITLSKGGLTDAESTWNTIGKKKWLVIIILSILLFLSNLAPDKKTFFAIIATPYIVDGSKTVIDSVNDRNISDKIGTIIDLGLDKAILSLQK